MLLTLSHVASVDAFQSWLYTSGEGGDRDARDAAWLRIRSRFERGVDWSGLERERVARWYRQLHIFLHPFYYIEYGLAQIGALQVWRNSMQDSGEAVRQYRSALALGATRSLPELYQAAGATFTFDVGATGQAGTFTSRILIDPAAKSGPPLTVLNGRWSVANGLALTAIVL